MVMPAAACRATASATWGSACPVMAPVSPRQRSTYSSPSTSTSRAPVAEAAKTGKAPGQRVIHGIGTPASSGPRACDGELGGAGVEVDEELVLGGPEIGEALAVDHEGNLGPPRMAPPRTRQWSREPPASPCASAPEVHRRRAPHAGGAQLLTSRGSVHAVAAGVLGRAPPRLGDPRRGGRRPVVQLGRGVRSHGTGGRRDRFRHRRGHCCAGGRPTVVRHRRARGLASRGGAHPRTARRGGRRQRPTALGRRRVVPGAPVR